MKIFIELENAAGESFPGQVIRGCLVIQNKKPNKFKEITISLHGDGMVRWFERRSSRRFSETTYRTVTINAEETYINQILCLAGDGRKKTALPIGSSSYPFEFNLPKNLPSSFCSKYGWVSYSLNAKVGADQSQEIGKLKRANWFAGRTGKLGFILHLKHSGFVPGEAVLFSCEIINNSNCKVKSMAAAIWQVTTTYAKGVSKCISTNICQIIGPAFDRGEHNMWTPDNLRVPHIPPTYLGGNCRIMDVQYILQVTMTICGLSSSLTGELPIKIGTVPLAAVEYII